MNDLHVKLTKIAQAKIKMINEFQLQIKDRENWIKMLDDDINILYESLEEINKNE